MSAIDSYIKQTAKKYPRTKEVAEQLEEIRDTLHIKTEEYQAQGLGQEEAAQSAINSIGDIRALMNDVAGESRTVYANKLFMHLSVIAMSVLSLELTINILLMALPFQVSVYDGPFSAFVDVLIQIAHKVNIMNVGGSLPGLFWLMLFPLLVVVWIWPVVSIVSYIREPQKTGIVQIRARRQRRIAWIGFLALSVILFILDMFPSTTSPLPHNLWFVWPVIFLTNWPLIIWNYGRMLKSGRYDA